MSGLPHPFDVPPGNDYVLRGNEIKPVTHITDWREDGVAKVQWCGSKFLFDPVVLRKGETKLCPVCGIELRYDRAKKEVVEGGFPKVPNRTGGVMNVELVKTLAGLLDRALTPEGIEVEYVAVHFETALRAAIRKAHSYGYSGRPLHAENENKCVTAGVAAMMEKQC